MDIGTGSSAASSGDPGSVEVGGDQDDGSDGSGDSSGGVTITVTISGGQCSMSQGAADPSDTSAQPCDIADALKAILDAYESQESPDGDEANFQAGLGASGGGTSSGSGGASSGSAAGGMGGM